MSPETVEQDGNDLDGRTFEDMTDISSTSEDEVSDDDLTSHFKVFVQFSDSDLEMSDDEQYDISWWYSVKVENQLHYFIIVVKTMTNINC